MIFTLVFLIYALSLPFRRPRDLQHFSDMQHSSAYATFVRTTNIFPHVHPLPAFALQFVRTCTICLLMQHLTAHAQFYAFGPIPFFRLRHFSNASVYPGRPRPALATPMAWHYSWHLIFLIFALSSFFLHFPSDAISSYFHVRMSFSGARRCVCLIVSDGEA